MATAPESKLDKAGDPTVHSGIILPTKSRLTETSFDTKLAGFIENEKNSSKVAGENGEPLVVYHGTGEDIEVMKAGIQADNSSISKPTSAPETSFDYKLAEFIEEGKDSSSVVGENEASLSCFYWVTKNYDQ